MFELIYTKCFKNSLKRYKHDKKAIKEITEFLFLLQTEELLPKKYNEHYLKGRYVGFLECHIRPDLLLIYNKLDEEKSIILYDIGSHSFLFGK